MITEMTKYNKWLKGAIPALLIHCSIGTVYCWSLLRDSIASGIGCTNYSYADLFAALSLMYIIAQVLTLRLAKNINI